MQIPGEKIIPLNANHRTMCRFGDATDGGYQHVLTALKRLAKIALLGKKVATKANHLSSNQYM